MTKKSIKKRISRRKRAVRQNIIQKVGGNTVGSNVGISAREMLLRNQNAGLVPQNLNMNPQMLAMQNKSESAENRTNELIKEMNSLKERYAKSTKNEIEAKREQKGLKKQLDETKKEAIETAKREDAIKDYQEEIGKNQRLIDEGVTKDELNDIRMKAEEEKIRGIQLAHNLKVADIRIEANRAHAEYLKHKTKNDLTKMELTEKEKIIQSKQFDNTVAEQLLKEELKNEYLNEEKARVLNELEKIERVNRDKQRRLEVMQDETLKQANANDMAVIQQQITAAQIKEDELDNKIYGEELGLIPLKEERAEYIRLSKELVRKQNESKQLGLQNSNLLKTSKTIGTLQKNTMTKLAAKERLIFERNEKIKDSERMVKLRNENERITARDTVDEAVNAEEYTGKNKDIIMLRNEKASNAQRLIDNTITEEENKILKLREQEIEKREQTNLRKKELMARINYGDSQEKAKQQRILAEIAKQKARDERGIEEIELTMNAQKEADAINRARLVKDKYYLNDNTAVEQIQVINDQLKSIKNWETEKQELINGISRMIYGNEELTNRFAQEYPQYGNLNAYKMSGNLDELTDIWQKLKLISAVLRKEKERNISEDFLD